MNKERITKHN